MFGKKKKIKDPLKGIKFSIVITPSLSNNGNTYSFWWKVSESTWGNSFHVNDGTRNTKELAEEAANQAVENRKKEKLFQAENSRSYSL